MLLAENIDPDAEWALFCEAARPVFHHGKSILGPEVELLEEEMAKWLQTKYAVGCNSGFGAHLISLLALDLQPGDRVLLPAFAPSDLVGILLRKKLQPVLIDIHADDFQMDVRELARHIDGTIKAIIVHHLFGGTVDMHEVMHVAGNIPVIEVLTYSLGARIDNRYAGTFGKIGTVDLLSTMGAWGDAGMLWTNDGYLAEKLRKIRAENGIPEVYTGIESGNFHQDTIQAAHLLRKLEGWKKKARNRSEQITVFAQTVQDRKIREIILPAFYNQFGAYLVVLAENRSELAEHLQIQGIETSTWWPLPIHLQPGFQRLGYRRGDFPAAERVAKHLLQLPVPGNEEEIDRLVTAIAKFYCFHLQRVY
jgi:dTDP-4-amino-4,6-dideoxygalactose transaminase